ncbi:MAG: cysteine dioxygenase [Streptosporangiaceae bacterium]
MMIISDTLVKPASDTLVMPQTQSVARQGRGRLSRGRLGRAQLGRIVAATAAQSGQWRDLVRYDPAHRWYFRMELTDEYEVWLLSWLPGQGTGFHDHGGSRGAFSVALGELQEQSVPGTRAVVTRTVTASQSRAFGARFVHHVVNNSTLPAVSVHAYSPPLPEMRRYEMTDGGLRYVSTEPAEVTP